MFVACMTWKPSKCSNQGTALAEQPCGFCHEGPCQEGAWVTTGDSVNLSLVTRLWFVDNASGHTCVAELVDARQVDLFGRGPDVETLYNLVGLMLDESGIGRWPPPVRPVPHLAPPGRN